MRTKLPIQTKEIIDGKLIKHKYEKVFEIDTSLASQIRFESKFPKLAEREDLFSYSKRLCEIKEITAPIIISKMKMLYCWFDTDIEFIDFLKLFDLTDKKYINELTDALKTAFELIFTSSSEKNS